MPRRLSRKTHGQDRPSGQLPRFRHSLHCSGRYRTDLGTALCG
jgi:hypothetical protein